MLNSFQKKKKLNTTNKFYEKNTALDVSVFISDTKLTVVS